MKRNVLKIYVFLLKYFIKKINLNIKLTKFYFKDYTFIFKSR